MTPLSDDNTVTTDQLSPGAQAEIRQLSQGLHDVHLQQNMQRRMSNFAYEPVSLPTSRVSRVVHYLATDMESHVYRLAESPSLSVATSVERPFCYGRDFILHL